MSAPELESRILQMLDGELPAEEAAALEAELLGNVEARVTYQKLARLHSIIETRHQARAFVGKTGIVPIERIMVRQRKRIVKFALGAAAAVALLGAVILSLTRLPDPPVASFRTSPGSVFTLTHDPDASDVAEGQVLVVGSRLHLLKGTMEGNFGSGVRVVIEAPSDLRVIEEDRIALEEGVAWFEVPAEAVGFAVETQEITVVDLGTAFGIHASLADRDEVHVTRGAVEVTSRVGGGETQTLREGEARRVDEQGILREIVTDTNKFATALPISDGLVGHWEFESQSDGVTPDSSGNGHSGRFEGSAKIVTDGERGKVLSLAGLRSKRDAVDIDSVSEIPNLRAHRGVTLAAWIKRNSDSSAGDMFAYVVGLGGSGDNPVVSLGIADANGFVTGYIEGETGDQHQVQVIGNTAVVDGVWTHVAITCDRANNQAITYVNGVPQRSPTDISIVGDGALDWSDGIIGRTPDITDINDRFFGGLIDDVRIYDRPLTAKEIRTLMR